MARRRRGEYPHGLKSVDHYLEPAAFFAAHQDSLLEVEGDSK
jgi:hypothetical protein